MVKQKAVKIAVSERALFQRINRRLKQDGEKLCTARGVWDGPTWHEDLNLGRYYVIDIQRNFLVTSHVDLQGMARELKVIKPWEELKGK